MRANLTLGFVKAIIHAAETRHLAPATEALLKRLAHEEWFEEYAFVEAWFYACNAPFLWEAPASSRHCFAWENAFFRPRRGSDMALGTQAVRPAAFVATLLWLHRFGVDLSVRAAVTALRPTLAKRRVLSGDEMSVWWAPREMGHMAETSFVVPDAEWPKLTLPWHAETGTGYRLFAERREDGIRLTSTPMRRARRRAA